jgi:phosphoadenylyl-sulfate reductase (thioredoxin)
MDVPAPSLDRTAVADLGREAQSWTPVTLLQWTRATFGRRVALATAFGAEGCVLIDLLARHRIDIDIFTLDTHVLFPETYELWRRLEAHYGVRVEGIQPDGSAETRALLDEREALWRKDPQRCCELRKLRPLTRALAGREAWVTAIRRDQTPTRATAQPIEWDAKNDLVKVNPLVTWTKADVWAYIRTHDVPYNPLHDRGYPSIGCWPCTSPVAAGEDDRAGRWRGMEKTECGLHIERTMGA